MLAVAEFLAMSLWFSASATTPALVRDWSLTTGQAAWLTMAVQLGFVAGALLSAVFNLADLWPPRVIFAAGALLGAVFNLLVPAIAKGLLLALGLRFATGAALAAVYPIGMKIMATWTKEDRGLGLGLLVGALTVGSASPHLVKALGGISDWRTVFYVVSGLATLGGVIGLWTGQLGPYRSPAPPFQWRYMGRSIRDPALRLANLGYLGHMWELYAMWTWIPIFLLECYRSATLPESVASIGTERLAAIVAFVVIALGGAGSLIAGQMGDRWGRTRTTILSMAMSGSCALMIGWFLHRSPGIATVIALVWGLSVVADSAQFSTSITELGSGSYIGTLLTTQTCMGFLLTVVSIRLVPAVVGRASWTWAFGMLAVGPAIGIAAMRMLGRSADAAKLAGGRG